MTDEEFIEIVSNFDRIVKILEINIRHLKLLNLNLKDEDTAKILTDLYKEFSMLNNFVEKLINKRNGE